MRILMITFNQVWRGTFYRALHFARSLVQRGHTVSLLAISHQERGRFRTRNVDSVTIVETPDLLWGPLRSGWDPWDTLARIGWLKGRQFDLVHAFEARPIVIVPALYMQRVRGVPLVLDWCDWFGAGGSVEERPNRLVRAALRPVETFFEEQFRTQADRTTVICSTLRDKAIALGVPPETILLVRNGADVEGLRPLDREESRCRLGLPASVPIIGYVGAIFYRDAQLMAQAFDRVHAAIPSARLLLIGNVTFDIRRMVDAPESVICTGFVNYADLNRYLAACDICWLPLCNSGANRGRWPLKLTDYMAVGRPTVATAVGDVAEVMQAHAIGLLAPATPADLALKVLALLADPERRAWLGHNARQVAENVFNWQLITTELERFYGQALSH